MCRQWLLSYSLDLCVCVCRQWLLSYSLDLCVCVKVGGTRIAIALRVYVSGGRKIQKILSIHTNIILERSNECVEKQTFSFVLINNKHSSDF